MKPKGINFFEQHIEKIVIGVAGLVVAGLGARQVLMQNTVQINNQPVPPSRVDAELRSQAESLQRNLDSTQGLEVQMSGSLTEWFNERFEASGSEETPALAVALVRPVPLTVGENDSTLINVDSNYAAFEPPAPKELSVRSAHYTLADTVSSEMPEVAEMLAGRETLDITAVHVFGEVSGVELREALVSADSGQRSIPAAWWENDAALFDVVIERQQLGADGRTWGPVETVSILPGQPSVRPMLDGATSSQMPEVRQGLQRYGSQIWQPPFLPLQSGEEWSPDTMQTMQDMNEETRRLVGMARAAYLKVQDLETRLARLEGRDRRDQNAPMDEPGGRGVGPEGGGPEGGGASDQPDTSSQDRQKSAVERLQSEIAAAKKAYEDAKQAVLDEVPTFNFPWEDQRPAETPGGRGPERFPVQEGGQELQQGPEGWGMEGGPTPEGGGKGAPAPEGGRGVTGRQPTGRALPLFEQEEIRIWAHDVTAEPGNVYRYRLRVGWYNPFFGREDRLGEEQRALAASAVTLSEPTEWSEPIRVSPPKEFFVIGGKGGTAPTDRNAQVEVYYYTNGQQHMSLTTLKPGDPIGDLRAVGVDEESRPVEVDFFTGSVLLDVLESSGGSGLTRNVRVLVALEDGSILTVNPDEHRNSEQRLRLRAMAAQATEP